MSVLLTCFYDILEKSLYGTFCILFILVFRCFIKHFPKVFSYCLWAVAGFRLLCSFSFQSNFNLNRLFSERILTSEVWDIPMIQMLNHKPIPSGNIITIPNGNPAAAAASIDMGYTVANNSFSLIELLSIIWLIGFLVFVGCSIFQYLRFSLRLKHLEFHKYGNYENVYESQGLSQAFTMGILNPRIYLPQDMSEEDRQFVILHERTHIRRRDFLFKPLGYGILCLHWFNPLVWLAFSLFCRDMEMSCDESVLRQLNGDTLLCKKDYSKVLLSMAGSRPLSRFPLFFGEPGVKQRIKNIMTYKKRTVVCSVILLVILFVAAFFLLLNTGSNKKSRSEYAVIMEQNQEWINNHLLFEGETPNTIAYYTYIMEDPNNRENQILVYKGDISDFNIADIDPDHDELCISSITRSPSSVSIEFQNEEYLTINAAEGGADFEFYRPMELAYADLNLDGEKELIFLFDLGYGGSERSYGLLIYTHTPDGWRKLLLPENYKADSGFPMQFVWDGNKMFLTDDGNTDNGLASYTKEDLIAINTLHGLSEEETINALSKWQDSDGRADAISDFSFYFEDGKPVFLTKQYVSGIFGNKDLFGCLIHEWRLSKDNTWSIQADFLLVPLLQLDIK